MQNDRRQSVKKVALVLASALVILLTSLYFANQDQTLEDVLREDGLYLISRASVTSSVHLSEENSFTYRLSEEESTRLTEILKSQQLNRLFFNKFKPEEYTYSLFLEDDRRQVILEVGPDKLHLDATNLYFENKTDDLNLFMYELFETHGN